MTLTGTALSERQIGGSRPARRLTVDGIPTEFLSLRAGYLKNGGSLLEPEGLDVTDDDWGAPVRLDIGYGDRLLNFFAGTLEFAPDGTPVAYGPFKLMAEQRLGEQVNYSGFYLEDALSDLAYHPVHGAGLAQGTIEVVAGRSHLIGTTVPPGGGSQAEPAGTIFPLETTQLEVAEALTTSAGFVFTDRPGMRKRAMPTPRPGATGKARAEYLEDHHGGFTPARTNVRFYDSVVVFRRNEDGTYAAYAKAPVENTGRRRPPKNRIYVIPEFVGTDEQASQAAYDTARSLGAGEFFFEIPGLAADPTILMHDSVRAWRTFEERKDRFRECYSCQISEEQSVELSPETHDMNLSVSALRVERRLVPKAVFFPSEFVSGSVVIQSVEVLAGLKPDSGLMPDTDLMPDVDLMPDFGLKPGTGLKPETVRQVKSYS